MKRFVTRLLPAILLLLAGAGCEVTQRDPVEPVPFKAPVSQFTPSQPEWMSNNVWCAEQTELLRDFQACLAQSGF